MKNRPKDYWSNTYTIQVCPAAWNSELKLHALLLTSSLCISLRPRQLGTFCGVPPLATALPSSTSNLTPFRQLLFLSSPSRLYNLGLALKPNALPGSSLMCCCCSSYPPRREQASPEVDHIGSMVGEEDAFPTGVSSC